MDTGRELAIDMGIVPGDVVAGKYRIVRVIGHGGMGVVVEAVHEGLEQRVAIKFLRPEHATSREATQRFLHEAKALAGFKSVHIARVTDVSGPRDEFPYFVMEYLEGHDLGAALAVDGTLPVTAAMDYAIQITEALAEAYTAGIVHRDIKPSNVFLTDGIDGRKLVKLLDFGISKQLATGDTPELSMTQTSAFIGSPRYMAPEQMRSTRKVDHRVDIWSLGVVLHEALTGEPPFVGETLPEVCAAIAADDPVRVRQLRRDVPIELQDVILRCLAKNPEQRYKDVGALAKDLAPFASPEAAVTAARVARIVERTSLRPGPMDVPEPAASAPHVDEPAYPAPLESSPLELGPPAPLPVPPKRPAARRWLLALVAVIAVPALIVGALVLFLPTTPEARPTPPSPATSTASAHAPPTNR